MTAWPLTAMALLFLAGYAWPILDPDLGDGWTLACELLTWAIWASFAIDYTARLVLSTDRRRFVQHNLFDLAVVVLPLIRPLRSLRLLSVLTILNRRAGLMLRGRVAVYVVAGTAMVVFVAALAVLDAERDAPDGNIGGFGDAVWWAITTISTVGYGDQFPTTGTGRCVAVALMLGGVALLGLVTASFAAWIIERVAEVEEKSQAATRRDLDELTEQVTLLRSELAAALARPPTR